MEINNEHLLFRLIRSTSYATVLSESTVHNEQGIRAILIAAREFINMLNQSVAVLHHLA